jgi:hypothetical protein
MKRLRFLKYVLLISLLLTSFAWGASTDYKVTNQGEVYSYDLITKGPWMDSRSYATLELADAAAAAAGKLLVIAQNHTLTANTVLASSVLRIPGGSFTHAAGFSLTFSGSFENPSNGHCFIGFAAGEVTGLKREVRPEWFATNTTPGTTDMTTAILSAIASLGENRGDVLFTDTRYKTSATIATTWANLISTNLASIECSAAVPAVTIDAYAGFQLKGLQLRTTNAAGGGIRITGQTRQNVDINAYICPLSGNSTGIVFDIYAADGDFVAGLNITGYAAHHKYGVKMDGEGSGAVTVVNFPYLWLVGSDPVTPGSVGFWQTSGCHGAGTNFVGVFELWDTAILHETGAWGGTFLAYFEGNNTRETLGADFTGSITPTNGLGESGGFKRIYKEGGIAWGQEQFTDGYFISEARYGHRHVLYGEANSEFSVHGMTSIIDGVLTPSPASELFGIHTSGSGFDTYATSFMRLFGNHKIIFSTAPPTDGSWQQGDRAFSLNSAVGEPSGWVCTHSGTFGAQTDSTGDTDGATGVITGMTDTSDFAVGMFVDVSAGFVSTGPYEILAKTASSITIKVNSNAAVNNITVDTSDPVFTAMANL